MSKPIVIALVSFAAAAVASACTAPNPAYFADSPAAVRMDAAETPLDGETPGAEVGSGVDSNAARAADTPSAPDAPVLFPDAGAEVAPTLAGLIARWRLDPGSGVAVPDDTGANAGALEAGATWNTGTPPDARFSDPGSLHLDGITGAAQLGVATLPALEHTKSVSLWFWVDAPPTADRKCLFAISNPPLAKSIQIGIEKGKLAVWSGSDAVGSAMIQASTAVDVGWNHVGYTYDGKSHTLYVHGSTTGTSGAASGPGTVVQALLGTPDPSAPGAERFLGLIDDVRVYDRAVSWSEMSDLAAGAP